MTRKEILKSAEECVCADRQQQYGSAEDNFGLIARLWGEYLIDISLTAKDVACMMALLKIARIRTGEGKDDNWIDLAGYAACGGEICGKQNYDIINK